MKHSNSLFTYNIKNNSNVNDTDNRGKSALYDAVERGNMVSAYGLLEAGASVEGKDDKERTVLHHVMGRGGWKGKSALHYRQRWVTWLLP